MGLITPQRPSSKSTDVCAVCCCRFSLHRFKATSGVVGGDQRICVVTRSLDALSLGSEAIRLALVIAHCMKLVRLVQ